MGLNCRILDKKVSLDVVSPFDLVSEYRKEWELRADGVGVGMGAKEKDNLPNQQVVLSCWGGPTRTGDHMHPMHVPRRWRGHTPLPPT